VQLPFLQYRLKKPFTIVPIIIGTQSAPTCKKIAEILEPWFTPENLFVISTDFSHYPSYSDAVKYDDITGKAISTNSPELFVQALLGNDKKNVPGLATSCCGWSSVLTMLYISSGNPDIKISHVKYMNSGDTPYGDKEKVVGYHSFIFTRENNVLKDFSLSEPEKIMLLNMARQSIENSLKNKPLPTPDEKDLTTGVKTQCGAFVTLNKNGKLRGCIGRFTATEPLYKVVEEMAQASAFQDTRFSPVTSKEMEEIEIEISVLTPLKRIKSIEEFELGKQGIYIIKGNRSGTFLPQVAGDTGWSKEEFLGHCARDKAGIGWDGWKDADLYTYEALVFNENEMKSLEK
jgi:AmmeMemoRadiSam system protein A